MKLGLVDDVVFMFGNVELVVIVLGYGFVVVCV